MLTLKPFYPVGAKHRWVVKMYHGERPVGAMMNTELKLVTDARFSTLPEHWRKLAKQTADSFVKVLNNAREPYDVKRGLRFVAEKV